MLTLVGEQRRYRNDRYYYLPEEKRKEKKKKRKKKTSLPIVFMYCVYHFSFIGFVDHTPLRLPGDRPSIHTPDNCPSRRDVNNM